MPKPTGPTNPVLRRLVRMLKRRSRELGVPLWRDLAERLSKPRRSRPEVNLGHIARCSAGEEIILVPGKVLGAGKLNHPLTIAAFKFSSTARRKILGSGGRALTILELLEQNPKGRKVKLVG